jgi:hypothetical protein
MKLFRIIECIFKFNLNQLKLRVDEKDLIQYLLNVFYSTNSLEDCEKEAFNNNKRFLVF